MYCCTLDTLSLFNTLKPRPNDRCFADDIFKRIFLNENVWISIKFSPYFVSKGPIHNMPALVQTMAWRRPGDKPLSEAMVASLLTHIYVAQLQRVKPVSMYYQRGNKICIILFNVMSIELIIISYVAVSCCSLANT